MSFAVDLVSDIFGGGSNNSPPPAPDYVGAANAQAAGSRELTDVQNYANRPQQYTPFGSSTWSASPFVDPATGKTVTQWTQNLSLTPQAQSALNSQMALQQGRSDLANSFMNRVSQEYAQPFNWWSIPQRAGAPGVAQLDSSLSNYAPRLDTDINSRAQNVVSAFGFGGPQMNVNPMLYGVAATTPVTGVVGNVDTMNSRLTSGVNPTPSPVTTTTPTTGVIGGIDPLSQNLTTSVGLSPIRADFDSKNKALDRQITTEDVQRGLSTADNPALPQVDSAYRDQVANQLFQRMVPLQQRAQAQLETKLSNQGFKQGSEAYRRALDELNARQAAERYTALDQAGNEAQRLYNMQMGSRQQALNEDVTSGQFANQAAQQAFNQGLNAAQFQNQATGQAFNQSLAAKQAQNQAQQQGFNQALAAGQFGNQAVQQAYAQNLGAAQFSNQAANQAFQQGLSANQFQNQAANQLFNQALQAGQFGNQAANQAYNQNLGAAQFANQSANQAFQQGLAANQFQNQAANQLYNQNLGAAQFGNQAQQQFYNQLLGQAQLNNSAQQQAFNQDLAASQFGNQALGQASALDIARMNAQNQALQNQFGLNLQAAQFQNQSRQQAIAEEAQRRGMSLNEMNALLSGQQVGMPQMPNFAQAGLAQTPQLLSAMNMGYDAQLGAYNAQQAQNANNMSGLFQLGSAAMPFLFSDSRLKSNIRRVGTHSIGVGIYDYTMMGMPQRGVIAQEVMAVRPDLVKRHANGFLMVNYGGL